MNKTLLITTFNRGALLRKSLDRLCGLTPPDELLVVDDGSSDDTEAVCHSFEDRLPVRYIYNHSPNATICSMARNIGFKEAKHDWIVTSEPELMYVTDVIDQFERLHGEHPNQIVSSGTVHFAPPEWNGALDSAHMERAGDYTPPQGSQSAIGWVAPYTALWHRPTVLKLGGWDESFPGPWGWDDIDLLTRLRITGVGQYIALDVCAVHQFHGLGGDANSVNEAHFRAKSFNQDESRPEDLVANKEGEWGRIIPRS